MNPDSQPIHIVKKNGADLLVQIVERRAGQVYVHYVDADKRLDEWMPDTKVRLKSKSKSASPSRSGNGNGNGAGHGNGNSTGKDGGDSGAGNGAAVAKGGGSNGRKRRRGRSPAVHEGDGPGLQDAVADEIGSDQPDEKPLTIVEPVVIASTSTLAEAVASASGPSVPPARAAGSSKLKMKSKGLQRNKDMTEEEFDIQHHKQITARRNFDKVNFGHWQIKTWYFSPYPLIETEDDAPTPSASTSGAVDNTSTTSASTAARIAGVARATIRSHGRTSDLLAGGLGREHSGPGERSTLWVCDRCFKYMADGTSWEAHIKRCPRKHPPGRKVYQRGAHTIWEVDGAKEKLYCQNLSLFGKLFIDIKTLFFDCDNFLFYLLTDADSQRDHVLGFFSKEKVSYDDYNLACIIVLPPYQRKGYGMLMIEFSYELSRRAGRVGTPERPLSDLGLRSYLTYWVSTLLRFLQRLLSVLPPELPRVAGLPRPPDPAQRTPSADGDERAPRLKRRRPTKGWDGEVEASDSASVTPHAPPPPPPSFESLRQVVTTANADGSATTHVIVRCTLAELARATNLRVDDAAFALNECGLLLRRRASEGEESAAGGGSGETVVVSREMVDAVAKARNVKKMCMDLAHVLL